MKLASKAINCDIGSESLFVYQCQDSTNLIVDGMIPWNIEYAATFISSLTRRNVRLLWYHMHSWPHPCVFVSGDTRLGGVHFVHELMVT